MKTLARMALSATMVVTLAAAAGAQHAGHGAASGHAPGVEGHRFAQGCAEEFDRGVAAGRGFGMAFAADQNGYPGPMHVLELRERLGLTPEQVTKAEALMRGMLDDARPRSARLLEAEARLRRLFADAVADEATVRAAAIEVERARSEVRFVHLLTHLRMRDLLTEPQRRLYHEARWGAR
jgi:Spy/CpxP family protein refolding chaperone